MKKDINDLKNEAEISCTLRGHIMEWEKCFFHKWSNSNLQDATCKKCGLWVQICDNPQPNGIDIGGPAIAVNCNNEKYGGGI